MNILYKPSTFLLCHPTYILFFSSEKTDAVHLACGRGQSEHKTKLSSILYASHLTDMQVWVGKATVTFPNKWFIHFSAILIGAKIAIPTCGPAPVGSLHGATPAWRHVCNPSLSSLPSWTVLCVPFVSHECSADHYIYEESCSLSVSSRLFLP